MTVVRWILALVLAAFFVYFGAQKFTGPNLIFSLIAERSNIALFEPVIRMLTGAAELLTALLLLFPRTRLLGAILGLGVLIGALGFHLSPWLGIDVPGIGTSLFMMAVGGFVVSLMIISMERKANQGVIYT